MLTTEAYRYATICCISIAYLKIMNDIVACARHKYISQMFLKRPRIFAVLLVDIVQIVQTAFVHPVETLTYNDTGSCKQYCL